MAYWLAGALLLAVTSLTAARYITSLRWVDALFATAAFAGLGVGLVVGILARRGLGPGQWKPVAALLLAVAAAAGRSSLLAQLALEPLAAPTIQLTPIFLACSSVVWGGLGLLWGALALAEATEGRTRWPALLVSSGAVALALYSLAPLWHLLGLRINHWTLLGLFGLACVAYLTGLAYRQLTRHKGDET